MTTEHNNKDSSDIQRKKRERRAGTITKVDCGVGRHTWFEREKSGQVLCYQCGKVLYKSYEDRPKTENKAIQYTDYFKTVTNTKK